MKVNCGLFRYLNSPLQIRRPLPLFGIVVEGLYHPKYEEKEKSFYTFVDS